MKDAPYWAELADLRSFNADLIAALQALLSEAEAMNADLRRIGKGRPEDGAHPDCPIDIARAAIAKATGQG